MMPLQKRKRDAAGAGDPPGTGMASEIELLRGLLRRGLELAAMLGDSEADQELARLMKVLESLSRSAARLGRLLVNSRELADDGLFGEAMREAMERAVRKMSSLDGEGGEHGRG